MGLSLQTNATAGRVGLRCGGEVMSDDLAVMIADAERRGARSLRTEPRARAVRYNRRTGRVHVDLTNGCSFAFPARSAGTEAGERRRAGASRDSRPRSWPALGATRRRSQRAGPARRAVRHQGLYESSARGARGVGNVCSEGCSCAAQRGKRWPAAQTGCQASITTPAVLPHGVCSPVALKSHDPAQAGRRARYRPPRPAAWRGKS
jgi:hypothetical protein